MLAARRKTQGSLFFVSRKEQDRNPDGSRAGARAVDRCGSNGSGVRVGDRVALVLPDLSCILLMLVRRSVRGAIRSRFSHGRG